MSSDLKHSDIRDEDVEFVHRHTYEIAIVIRVIYSFLCSDDSKKHHKERKYRIMDILATLAAIKAAVVALKNTSPAPTSNFATDDVKASIADLASASGVTPVQLVPAAPAS